MATGWGSKTWGASDWGDLSNETVSVSGIALEITNVSSNGTEFTAQADAQISTAQSKFGGSSLALDGSGDRIQSTDITLGTDNYTWETFAYFNSLTSSQCIWDAGENVGASQNPVVYITSTNLQLSYAGGTYINAAHGMSVDTWHHIAIVRDGTQLEAFIDGTSIGTATYSLGSGATNHVLGGNFAGTFTVDGYLDESRLTRKAVYTSNFTPPTQALPNDRDNDIWLLHYDGTNGSTEIVNSALFSYTEQTSNISVTGQELTFTNGGAVAGASADVDTTGIQASFSVGQAIIGITVPVTSAGELQTTIGTATVDESTLTGEGWGRDAWGDFAWGVNYSVQLSGIEMTLTGGEEDAGTDFVAEVTGQELTSTQGSISLQIDQDIFVLASEDQIDASVGSVSTTADANISVTGIELSSSIDQVVPEPKLDVDVTGISASMTLGAFTLEQSTVEGLTGQELTSSIGEADLVFTVNPIGISASTSVGSVSVVISVIPDISGISMTASLGPVEAKSWEQIDPGVNNTWNEIDTGVSNTWQDIELAA